jgi:phosphotransferase system IIA component
VTTAGAVTAAAEGGAVEEPTDPTRTAPVSTATAAIMPTRHAAPRRMRAGVPGITHASVTHGEKIPA